MASTAKQTEKPIDRAKLAQISIGGAAYQLSNTKSLRIIREISLWMFTRKDCSACSGQDHVDLKDFNCLCCANGCNSDKIAKAIWEKLLPKRRLQIRAELEIMKQS